MFALITSPLPSLFDPSQRSSAIVCLSRLRKYPSAIRPYIAHSKGNLQKRSAGGPFAASHILTAVDEIDHLLLAHASPLLGPHSCLLLFSPVIHVQRIFGVTNPQLSAKVKMPTHGRGSHMHECAKSVRQSVVFPQFGVYEKHVFRPQLSQATLVIAIFLFCLLSCGVPFSLHFIIAERSETNAPSFEYDDFYRLVTSLVHSLPFRLWSPISRTVELALVIAWYSDILLAMRQRFK